MYQKIVHWFRRRSFGAHWFKLLIADCGLVFMAGLAAYAFNHGFAEMVINLGTLLWLEFCCLPAWLLGFILLRTYNTFLKSFYYGDFVRSLLALGAGASLLLCLWRTALIDQGVSGFEVHDLALQVLFALLGMCILRNLIKMHYDLYTRRGESNGAYGLDDIALLNMEMSDLLQRNPIEVDTEAIQHEMRNRRILVTGAGGSIGSELVRLLAGYDPAVLLLVDQAETPLHDVRMMMERDYPDVSSAAVVTDICHSHRMECLFEHYRPEVIFHAAAYKHVPMMEDNPVESVLNNIDSTKKLADLAVRYGTEKFVLISTDKAVNPTNIMGCSKRICEIYCQSLAHDAARRGRCQFITTRFGNVLGSNGSVVPIFREQIRRGGPVRVTHPDIIRYFMLIPEACELVLEAATLGRGGEIFAFDMGKPVRIADLARRMIAISRRRDIKIEYTGLRPGEKLYEEVLNDEETVLPTSHEKIKVAQVRAYDFAAVSRQIDRLIAVARTYDAEETVRLMGDIVPEYQHANKKNYVAFQKTDIA